MPPRAPLSPSETPPFPADWRSNVPVIPPNDSGLPLPPGAVWAGDRCQPQRIDSEAYRRAVHLGEITPTGIPAFDGVAFDAALRRAAAEALSDVTTHRRDRVQISPASADYDHGAFSQSFG